MLAEVTPRVADVLSVSDVSDDESVAHPAKAQRAKGIATTPRRIAFLCACVAMVLPFPA